MKYLMIFALFASAAAAQNIDPAQQINWPRISGSGSPVGVIACPVTTNTPTAASVGRGYTDKTGNHYWQCGNSGWFQVDAKTVVQVEDTSTGVNQDTIDFNSTTPPAPSGFTNVTWQNDFATGRKSAYVPATLPPALAPVVTPPVPGQYVILYPHTGAVTRLDYTGLDVAAFGSVNGASGTVQIGPMCSLAFTNSVQWSGYTLADYGINPANVTAVYAFAISNYNGIGQGGRCFFDPAPAVLAVPSLGNAGANMVPPLATWGWGTQQVTALTGLSGAGIATATATASLTESTQTQMLSNLLINSMGLIVYYTGTPVTSPSHLNVAAPLTYDIGTNTLGVDPNFPRSLYTYTVASAPAPASGVNSVIAMNRSTDCQTDDGNVYDTVICGVALSGPNWVWTPITSGGGGGDTITSPGSTLTVGGTPTATTLDLNLGHANTWTTAQTFSDIIDSALTPSTSPICPNGTGGRFTTTGCTGGGGGGVSGSGTTGFLPKWTGSTALGNSAIDDGITTASTITSTEPIAVVAASNPTQLDLTYNTGHAPAGSAGKASIAPDTTGNLDVSENGAGYARVCTATNGVCTGGTPLASRVSCVTYGCVADGNLAANTGTDNTTPFTNCLTAAIAANDTCYVPAGVYRVATSLPTINTGGTGFVADVWGYDPASGAGIWVGPTTTIFSSSASATILTISSGSSSYITGDTLQNISLQRGVTPTTGSIALKMDHAAGAVIKRNNFFDSATGVDITEAPAFGIGAIEHNQVGWGYSGIGCGTAPHIGFNMHGGSAGFRSLFLTWNAVADNCGGTASSDGYDADGALIDLNMENNQTSLTDRGIHFAGTVCQDVHIVDQTDDANRTSGEYFTCGTSGVHGNALELRGGWTVIPTVSGVATELDAVSGISVSDRQYFGGSGAGAGAAIYVHNGSTANAIQNNTMDLASISCNGSNRNNYSGNTAHGNFTFLNFVNCSNNVLTSNVTQGGGAVDADLDVNSNNNYSLTANTWGTVHSPQFNDAGTGNQEPVINASSAPSGACTLPTPAQYVTTTGAIWGCVSSLWTSVGGTVSPLTTKGDVYTFSTVNTRLPVGANGTVLTADSTQATGLNWTTPLTNPMTTQGDLIVGGTSGAATRLAAAATNLVLTSNGVGATPSWQASSGGALGSWQIDDFNTSAAGSSMGWVAGSAGGSNPASVTPNSAISQGHQGVWATSGGTTNFNDSYMQLNASSFGMVLPFSGETVNIAANVYGANITHGGSLFGIANGILNNLQGFNCNNSAGGQFTGNNHWWTSINSTNVTDTGVVCDSQWHVLELSLSGAGVTTFYIDGVSVGTSSTAYTSAVYTPVFFTQNYGGSSPAPQLYIDWFAIKPINITGLI